MHVHHGALTILAAMKKFQWDEFLQMKAFWAVTNIAASFGEFLLTCWSSLLVMFPSCTLNCCRSGLLGKAGGGGGGGTRHDCVQGRLPSANDGDQVHRRPHCGLQCVCLSV